MMAVPSLILRTRRTEATVGKFRTRQFRWGSCDCAKVAAHHLRKFGWIVPKSGGYRTEEEARARLTELGFSSMPDLIGSLGMEEIAPAFALTGDIVSFASDHDLGALGIVVGNGLMMAFHEDHPGLVFIRMEQVERAWSVMKSRSVI